MLRIIIAPIIAWGVAPVIKFIIHLMNQKKIDLSKPFKPGGMPSGHSSAVSALTLSLFLYEGFTTLFAVTLVFSMIVLRGTLIRSDKKKHKPLEVIIGLIIGLLIAYLMFYLL